MRSMQKLGNALLMATLARPVTRVVVSRWRKRARESKAAPVALPMQELLEAALVEELGGSAVGSPPPSGNDLEAAVGRSTMRTLLIAGVVVAVIAIAVAAVIRRRRAAREAEEWVAVSVETATDEAEEVVSAAEEALAE
jgi:hypothetical protein